MKELFYVHDATLLAVTVAAAVVAIAFPRLIRRLAVGQYRRLKNNPLSRLDPFRYLVVTRWYIPTARCIGVFMLLVAGRMISAWVATVAK
jgi:hypothetical protein